ncbi:MAG: hypothetical protein FD123_1522 [Bacteroidetes bacterium]|nr:MAG: hypothetical protein FD123_1522 [Bacteroidota bacterium]
MGMLSVICNDIDTVPLGTLPAGTYTITYLLDGGFGLPTCSPAFVPFDTLVTTFTVALPTGMDELQAGNFSLMPNPASGGKFTIGRPKHTEGDVLLLYAADGRLAQRIELHSEKETISVSLAQGLYFAGLESNGHIGALKKIVITQ